VLLLFFSDCRIYLFSSLAARVFNKLTRYSLLVIIGNVPGVSDEDNTRLEAQAVVRRAQAKQQFKPIKPLKVIENLREDVTRETLIALQGQDPSLAKFVKEAEQNQKAGRAEVYFKMKDGILYRYCRNFEGREIS